MRRFLNIFLAVSVSCVMMASVLPALGETDGGQGQNGIAVSEVNVLPEIMDLRPGWWRYFDISDIKELNKRIALFDKRLQESTAAIEPKQKKVLSPLVVKIRADLNALRDIKIRKPSAPSAPSVLAEKYSVSDLIKLLKKSREKQTAFKEDTIDTERLSSTVNDALQHLNDLMVSYMSKPERSAERFESGFQIVAKRLDVMIAQEDLRIHKSRLQTTGLESEFIAKEIEHARKHLFAYRKDLKGLKQQIKEAELALPEKKKHLISAEIGSIGIPLDTIEDKSTARLYSQRAIFASVDEARARINLETARTELMLVNLLMKSSSTSIVKMREKVKAWQALSADLQSKADYWDRTSAREYARAGEDISVLGEDATAKAKVLRRIHRSRLKAAQDTLLAVKDLRLSLATEDFMLKTFRDVLSAEEGKVSQWFAYMRDRAAGSWAVFTGTMRRSLFTISETPVTLLGLFWLVLIIVFAFLFSRIFHRVIERLAKRSGAVNESAIYTLSRLIHYVIIIMAVIIGLSSIGINFSSLIVVAGALSLGIGFGLQSIFNNFISGLILLFERPLKIGDVVELESSLKGTVREINVRSTRITTFDNIDILVPNSEFISGRVTNYTLRDAIVRIHLPVGVAYGTETGLVKTALMEAADSLTYTVKHPEKYRPQVRLVKFGDSSLDFELLVWVNIRSMRMSERYRYEYMLAIAGALKKHNISIPFPQRDVHIRSTHEGERSEIVSEGAEKGSETPET